MTQIKCNLCGSNEVTDWFELSSDKFYDSDLKQREIYTIVKCDSCGLIFVKEPVSPHERRDIYSEGYYTGRDQCGYKDYVEEYSKKSSFLQLIESFLRKPDRLKRLYRYITRSLLWRESGSRNIEVINKYIEKSGKLLDVGCAFGLFLATAKNSGWDVTGVEISEFASKYAKNKLKLNVITGELEGLIRDNRIEKNSFDVVTLWDTLEHVCDPSSLLRGVRSVLKDEGLLFLSTLNIDSLESKEQGENWHFFRPPKHLFYYSERTLKHLLNKTGFELILDDDFRKDVVVIGARKEDRPSLRRSDNISSAVGEHIP